MPTLWPSTAPRRAGQGRPKYGRMASNPTRLQRSARCQSCGPRPHHAGQGKGDQNTVAWHPTLRACSVAQDANLAALNRTTPRGKGDYNTVARHPTLRACSVAQDANLAAFDRTTPARARATIIRSTLRHPPMVGPCDKAEGSTLSSERNPFNPLPKSGFSNPFPPGSCALPPSAPLFDGKPRRISAGP